MSNVGHYEPPESNGNPRLPVHDAACPATRAGREVHSLSEARDALAVQLGITPEEREEILPSGRQRRFDNRVAWAKVYLEQAGLLSSPRRAHFRSPIRADRS